MIRRPPRSTLFPYTTLFRSVRAAAEESDELGFLEKSFNRMLEEIGTTISTVQREADEVAAFSEQLAASAERSEEHTSELQSPCNLVCRLLLEKKKNKCIDLK